MSELIGLANAICFGYAVAVGLSLVFMTADVLRTLMERRERRRTR